MLDADRMPENIALDGLWSFAYSQDIDRENTPAVPSPEQFEVEMPVPGYWDEEVERLKSMESWSRMCFNPDYNPFEFPMTSEWLPNSSLPFIVGVGWYKKRFEIPEHSPDALATLCIGGVRLEAWVWLNGEFMGYHLGHSTVFEIPLQETLVNGAENELIIAVANTRRDRLGCDLRGYKGFMGGIRKSVELKITGEARIADLYLLSMDDNLQINWTAELKGSVSEKVLTVDWAVKEPGTGNCLKSGTTAVSESTVSWSTDNCGMQNWSDNEPNLYEIEVRLCRDAAVLDSVTQNFGLRTIKRKGTSLRLNSKPLFLRGQTEHCYYPLTCVPPSDLESYRRIILKLKELGFNWTRCHTWVPSEEFMQAADELGMMFQVEPPVGFGGEEWVDIIRACRKHPSVVIYCCGNEEFLDEEKITVLKTFAELCKQHAPDALFNPQEGLRGIEYVWSISDWGADITEKHFQHNPVRLKALREFSDVFGNYSWGYLSYISSMGNWHALTERMAAYERPCLAHEIGIQGSYLDLSLEKRYENTYIGTDLYAQTKSYLDKMGLVDKAPLYYRNSCAWQRLLRKHCIETARKCLDVAGYDLLGAIDTHNHNCGYNCGIMNEFYELKPGNTVKNVTTYSAESILLLDNSNHRNLHPGQDCQFDLMASLFGSEALSAGTVFWRLTDGERDFASGQIPVNSVSNGVVQKIGRIEFTIPRLVKAVGVKLHTELKSREYELRNDWDFWMFPETIDGNACVNLNTLKNKPEKELRVVSSLDTDTLEYLEMGGSTILLGTGPFPSIPAGFQVGLPGRAGGNAATVIYQHPITGHFPHEGFCDWQFYSMLEDSNGIVFNDLGIPFDPIIELASSYKLVYEQSLLFELVVGKGKLLVCTLNLDVADPAAQYLSGIIMQYAQSDEFKPCNRISCDDIVRITNTTFGPYGIPSTDMAYDPNAQL